jgi:hypothetical protein
MAERRIMEVQELLDSYHESFINDYELWKETLILINNKIKSESKPEWTKIYTYKYNAFCTTFLKRMKLWIDHYGYFNEMSSASILGTLIQLKLRQSEKNWIKLNGDNPIVYENLKKEEEELTNISEWFYPI